VSTNPSKAVVAGGGLLAAAAVWLSHETGAWGHDLPTVFGWVDHHASVPHVPAPIRPDPFTFAHPVPVKDSISAGVSTMQKLREGTDTDKIVYKVACTCMNGAISETADYDEIRQDIYDQLPDDYRPGGFYYRASSIAVNKAAKALVAATSDGGFSANYYRFCYTRP
jgi:hypothetical protein